MKRRGRTGPGRHALQGCAALCGVVAQAARLVAQAGCFPNKGLLLLFRPLGDAGLGYVDSIPVTRRPLPRAVQQQP